ncbi:unnamed protein product (macronuclear) [Paramecium tetraurelia]|uniref:Protein yippee-like n=1 Tax=Paramecium tetraurelia TaxID=5888 RepID=A0D238_PARTE|nr:uncharacterized protein GSPATT00012611001 [Paramecium tetraurelia]CAK77105.1 unnamed protein product [Paramecium tetraurelia]|eukprot:XP_001444502.1 hypothetical protein (macronuclear) [Paramecium tetraurelia strain d4-2]
MGKIILEYFDGDRIYVCSKCHIHISNYKSRISKNFRGGFGQAFLFEKGINYHVGQSEVKDLMTGKHTVQDVICNGCNKVIGWKYIKAYRESEKYKEGKIIIERHFIRRIKWN